MITMLLLSNPLLFRNNIDPVFKIVERGPEMNLASTSAASVKQSVRNSPVDSIEDINPIRQASRDILHHTDWVFRKCLEADIFDVALKIVSQWPEIITNGRELGFGLRTLALKTDAFRGTKQGLIWRIICPSENFFS
ncbi:hypothetical protein L2E82_12207 [Cichorium intybus]|uniref:Uncharacterized protein n=1 Tax=Cichorium intybus TaxID=13427 RepID=A0ACB9GG70_CICIN|nr:hypothetical protein L2E82_12207 [Cichorium intybus]